MEFIIHGKKPASYERYLSSMVFKVNEIVTSETIA